MHFVATFSGSFGKWSPNWFKQSQSNGFTGCCSGNFSYLLWLSPLSKWVLQTAGVFLNTYYSIVLYVFYTCSLNKDVYLRFGNEEEIENDKPTFLNASLRFPVTPKFYHMRQCSLLQFKWFWEQFNKIRSKEIWNQIPSLSRCIWTEYAK